MTGPTKGLVIITLAVIVMVSLNIAMWRRMRGGLAAAKAEQAFSDFVTENHPGAGRGPIGKRW
jgi:hypothetical protein